MNGYLPTWADSTLTESGGTYTYVRQQTTTYTFNSSGSLTSISDPNGETTTLSYSSGILATVTNPSGQTLTFAFGTNGLVSSVTDPMSRVTQYGYDSAGNLITVTDPMSHVTSFTYGTGSAAHLLLTLTLPNGQTGGPDAGDSYTNTYNSSGQVLTETDPNANVTTFSYSGNNYSDDGGTTTITDPDATVTADDFIDGEMASSAVGSSTGSATWLYGYDQNTFGQNSEVDPDGNSTSATFDTNGNMTSSTNAIGYTTTDAYNSLNEQICATTAEAADPCSSLSPPSAISPGSTITPPSSAPPEYVTYTEYDTDGNKIYTTAGDYNPGSGSASQLRTTYELYNSNSVTLSGTGDSCTTSAPTTSLPCAKIDADDVVTQLAYNSAGDLTSSSTPTTDAASNPTPGTIDTFAGGTEGSIPASDVAQLPGNIAAATVSGTSYAYVTDSPNNLIRRVNLSTGYEQVVAGSYAFGDQGDSGPATDALLAGPGGTATNSSGDLVITNYGDDTVRFVPKTSGTYFGQTMTGGDIYTIAGQSYVAGYSGDGAVATSAELDDPADVAYGPSGGVTIVDANNQVIRFVPNSSGTYFGQSMTGGDIYTIAGNGTAGYSGDLGAATSAELSGPRSISFDSSGGLAIADSSNNVVRYVPATSGTYFGQSMTADDMYTIAGDGTAGSTGDAGPATSAEINAPGSVAFDSSGNLAIADGTSRVIRYVPITSGTHFGQSMTADDIYTVAGDPSTYDENFGGPATSSGLANPTSAAFDSSGDLLIGDYGDTVVAIVAATSRTIAGQAMTADDIYSIAGNGWSIYSGDGNPAPQSEISGPERIRVDAAGDMVIADSGNDAIRFIPKASGTYYGQSMAGGDIYTIAGVGYSGDSGDSGVATSAVLNTPNGADIGSNGNVAIADTGNNLIRYVPAVTGTYFGESMTANHIYTVAGNGTAGYSGDSGAATSAELNEPAGVAIDSSGGIVIADTENNVIRYVSANSATHFGQSMTAGDIYTIAGTGTAGYSGDTGGATSAELNAPQSVSLSTGGNVVIADSSNSVVRYLPITSATYYSQSMTANHIYTIAGSGSSEYNGVAATSAELAGGAADATLDAAGDIYIAQGPADIVRFVPVSSGTYYNRSMTAGDIYTVAGHLWTQGYSGDNGPATSAQTWYVQSVVPDPSSGFYLSDWATGTVRYVTGTAPATPPAETTYSYNSDGEQTSTTSPDGNVSGANAGNYTTTTTYNDDGEKTAVSVGNGSGHTVTPQETDYGYDSDGNQTSTTDPRGKITTAAFTPNDQQTLVTDPNGDATLTCYDGVGHVAQTVPPAGVAAESLTPASCPTSYPTDYGDRLASDATTFAFNALGEVLEGTGPVPAGLAGYETTTSAYDPAGRLSSITGPPTSTTGGAPNNVTAYTYNAAGEMLTTTMGSGTTAATTTSYCYDPNGDKTAEVAPDGNTTSVPSCSSSSPYDTSSGYQTTFSFNSLGEVVSTTAPDTSVDTSGMTTTTTYDPAGNVLTSTDPNGVTTTATYTPLDQLASVSYSGSSAHGVTYAYDANGNQTEMVDATGTSTSTYNAFGELSSAQNGDGKTVSYTYDAAGNETGVTYPLGSGATWASSDTISYGYNDASQLTSVTDFNGTTSNVTNNVDGLPTALSLGSSGDTINTAYDAGDGPSSITLTNGSTLQEFAYLDEPSGAILKETDTPSSAIEPAIYTYDAQSRVTQMAPGSNPSLNYTEDASGNLTTLPTGASGTYDNASELTSSVLSGTTTNYTYDANGNQTGASVGGTATVSGVYNGANELTSYTNPAANMTSATYAGNGLRASATTTPAGDSSTSANFIWNTTKTVPQLLMDGTYAYIYGPGSTPLAEVNLSTGTLHYLVADGLGSVRGVVTSSGSLTASTSYDAWGSPETTGGLTSYTPFGFAGGYTDPTGLIYLINRYYDPTTGQFINIDPDIASTGQAYTYAGDNPVDETDPSGLSIWGAIGHFFKKTLGCASALEGAGPPALLLDAGIGAASFFGGPEAGAAVIEVIEETPLGALAVTVTLSAAATIVAACS